MQALVDQLAALVPCDGILDRSTERTLTELSGDILRQFTLLFDRDGVPERDRDFWLRAAINAKRSSELEGVLPEVRRAMEYLRYALSPVPLISCLRRASVHMSCAQEASLFSF